MVHGFSPLFGCRVLAEAVHHVLLAAREAGTFERMVETVTRILLANAEAALDEGDDDE